ncbi:MAG TPA: cyclic nucleotide-binding domain-containing protein [Thermoanaerobaculia bacterium]
MLDSPEENGAAPTDSPSQRARAAARRCEAAGLNAEADILYRLAETTENQDRTSTAASFARVLMACGRIDQARPFALEGNDPVLVARLLLEVHNFADARRLLDEARHRDPFDPRVASARGRLAFLERRFGEAVWDLLEAALLRPDGLPDATDRRFLRAARALAPGEIPAWKDAVSVARDRLEQEARRRCPGVDWPDRSAELLRSLIRRGSAASEGVLERARRLAELPALHGMDELALFSAAAAGELRRLANGSSLYKTGDRAGELSIVIQGAVALSRATPVGEQPLGEAQPGDVLGEEALLSAPRVSDARARGAVTLLGFPPDFFSPEPDHAVWLRYLRSRLARRLSGLNDLFRQFWPEGEATRRPTVDPHTTARASDSMSLEEKSRSLTTVGLSESDRFLFAAFAEEKLYPAGAVIFREGDAGDAISVIARGRVRISRQISGGEEAFAILSPGEIFGEMALLDPGTGRSADAVAHEDATVLELSRPRFEALESSDPEGCGELSLLLCRLAARRAVETAERLASWRVLAGPG